MSPKKITTEERKKLVEVLHALCVGTPRAKGDDAPPRKPVQTARQVFDRRQRVVPFERTA